MLRRVHDLKMLFHRHLKLPRFRLTQRSTSGAVVQKDVARGLEERVKVCPRSMMFEDASTPTAHDRETPGIDLDRTNCEPTSEPTLYAISRKASVAAWNSLRQPMLEAVTESRAVPEEQECTFCLEARAKFRCVQCGPYCYYCDQCLAKLHLHSNIFHVPEQWKVSTYMSV